MFDEPLIKRCPRCGHSVQMYVMGDSGDDFVDAAFNMVVNEMSVNFGGQCEKCGAHISEHHSLMIEVEI